LNSASIESPSLKPGDQAIVVGASARACAQSLLRVGITPIAVDLFCDRDLKQIARTHICPIESYPQAIPGIIQNQLADVEKNVPVVITGAMENYPDVLRQIEKNRQLWGGSADAVQKARSWDVLRQACETAGGQFVVAQPRYSVDTPREELAKVSDDWVMKPVFSSAGHSMHRFDARTSVPEPKPHQKVYFQPWIQLEQALAGPASAQLVACDGRVKLMGVTSQLSGDKNFGARYETQFVGNCYLPLGKSDEDCALEAVGQALADAAGLTGLFGLDFLPVPQTSGTFQYRILEVNPRYTAAMELIDQGAGCLVFGSGAPVRPTIKERLKKWISPGKEWGKAIVYAKSDCMVPDLWASFSESEIADVPQPGERVPLGRPICTVLAQTRPPMDCYQKLQGLAQRVYTLCQP
jgi:uncharacterized protein